jgi:uncharacterized protein with GYD domain
MLSYIVLATFTDQGIRDIRNSTRRADSVKETAGRFGVKMKDIYWTQGQYDLVTLCEAQDEARVRIGGFVGGQCPLPDAARVQPG